MLRKQRKLQPWRRFGYVILIIIKSGELLLWFSPRIINGLRSYIKHSKGCFIRYPNTLKLVKKNSAAPRFLNHFSVFGYRMKHSSSCYNIILDESHKWVSTMLALSILVWHLREKCIILLLQVFTINIIGTNFGLLFEIVHTVSGKKKERVSLSHSKSDHKLSPLPFALAWFFVTLVWLALWTMIVENIGKVFKQTAWSWKSNFLFTLFSVPMCATILL